MLDGRCGVAQAEFGETEQEVGGGKFGIGLDRLVQLFKGGDRIAGGEGFLGRSEVGLGPRDGGRRRMRFRGVAKGGRQKEDGQQAGDRTDSNRVPMIGPSAGNAQNHTRASRVPTKSIKSIKYGQLYLDYASCRTVI